jgi:hypothetical protein
MQTTSYPNIYCLKSPYVIAANNQLNTYCRAALGAYGLHDHGSLDEFTKKIFE